MKRQPARADRSLRKWRTLYALEWNERRKRCYVAPLNEAFIESMAVLLFGFHDYGRIIAVFRHKEAAEEFARVINLAKQESRGVCAGRVAFISGRFTAPQAAAEFSRAMAWIEKVEIRL